MRLITGITWAEHTVERVGCGRLPGGDCDQRHAHGDGRERVGAAVRGTLARDDAVNGPGHDKPRLFQSGISAAVLYGPSLLCVSHGFMGRANSSEGLCSRYTSINEKQLMWTAVFFECHFQRSGHTLLMP